MSQSGKAVEVFCCYAHKDEGHFRELEKHLGELIRQGLILLCHDQQIPAGANWAKAIDEHLERALIILLLISPDFLASHYCSGMMNRALEQHERGKARVIPVVVRPVDWKCARFAHLKALPSNANAITSWSNQDEAFVDVVNGIRRVIEDPSLLSASAPRATLPAIWNIPYPQNSFFLGRDDVLERLHKQLKAGSSTGISQPQAICGLGGMGKTQIAVEYAYRYHKEYEAVLWTLADTRESLVSGYVAIAGLLNLLLREEQDQMLVVNAVLQWFKIHTQWLLILDNADDLALVREFLPLATGGHVLLTTQAHAMGRLARCIELERMDLDVGALFLLRRARLIAEDAELSVASRSDIATAKEITEELDGLPLALDQAGAYVEETQCSLSNYQQLYRTQRTVLLQRRGGVVRDHPEAVATTWSLSFEKVEQRSPAAADLLRLCAYLAPDAIPGAIITQGMKHPGPSRELAATDPFLLDQAIKDLCAYSLLKRDRRTHALSIHRLVQTVVCDALPTEKQMAWMQRAVIIVNAAFPNSDQVCREQWLPHALVCARWIEQEKMVSREAANLLLQTGHCLCERARYVEAEPLYEHSLRIFEQSLGPEDPDVASTLSGLANVYSELGKYEDAETGYRRSLRIFEQSLGPEDPDVASTLSGLANVYSELGKYEDAETGYRCSLRIFEQSLGPDHLKVAPLLNNLAILRKVQGKYEEAEQLYQHSLSIWEQNRGPDHPDVAQSLNNLAVLYAEQGGKYATAALLFKRSLHIFKQHLGPEHPRVAQSLNNLANLYTEQGKYAKALQLFQRSLRIRGWSLSPEDPDVAQSLNNLANLDPEQSKYVESLYQRSLYTAAEKLYEDSLRIFKQHLGPKHPNVAYPLNGQAILRKLQGEYEDAERLFKDSLDIWEQNLRPEHPQVAYSLNNRAVLYAEQGKYDEAEELFQRSLHIFKQHLGRKHIHIRTCAKNYAYLLHFLNRDAEAQEVEKEYLSSD